MGLAVTEKQKSQAMLLIGAVYFAMRSCEYLKTSHSDDSKKNKNI